MVAIPDPSLNFLRVLPQVYACALKVADPGLHGFNLLGIYLGKYTTRSMIAEDPVIFSLANKSTYQPL